MHISELFDEKILAEHINNGIISAQRNEDDDLTIYNYSRSTNRLHLWDDVTRACRGLIVDDDGEVIARPFPKFFSYGDTDNYDEEITPDTEVTAYDKLDGSLGIVYWDKKGVAKVATRGSFMSPMAIHASKLMEDILIPNFENITMLVEIIYPDNQIVIDYHGLDGLFLLGGIHIPTGDFITPLEVFTEIRGVYPEGGFKYMTQDYNEISTVQDALNNLNRMNREGFVLHTDAGTMVKVKQDDYVKMHKAVFNTSKRNIWYAFAHDMLENTGKPFDEVVTRNMKLQLSNIVETGGTEEFLSKVGPLLPNNLRNAAEQAKTEYTNQTKKVVDQVISFLQNNDFTGSERVDIYEAARDKFGVGLAGIVTDIVTATTEDRRVAGFDRLVLSVVESIMPKKGDRLTEALTEEDE